MDDTSIIFDVTLDETKHKYLYRGGDTNDTDKFFVTEVTVHSSVTEIEDRAFYGWINLEVIYIPSTVTCIGRYSFYNCSSLKRITLPSSLLRIESSAFEDCKKLLEIYLPQSIKYLGSAFLGCSSLSKVVLPERITHIEGYTFSGCKSLQHIDFPTSITHIGEFAFQYCVSLSIITLPNSVKEIYHSAFASCKSLSILCLPNSSNLGIASLAFDECVNLQIIYIPVLRVIYNVSNKLFASSRKAIILTNEHGNIPPYVNIRAPILTPADIESCLQRMPRNIPCGDQLNTLNQVIRQRFNTIGVFIQYLRISLLHLLIYFRYADIHQIMADLCEKFPLATLAVDKNGMTPLHHVITCPDHLNMDERTYQVLVERSLPEVVHRAIDSKAPWHHVRLIVKIKINSLIVQDSVTKLIPFMMVSVNPNRNLTAVYDLLRLQPDVIKMYID